MRWLIEFLARADQDKAMALISTVVSQRVGHIARQTRSVGDFDFVIAIPDAPHPTIPVVELALDVSAPRKHLIVNAAFSQISEPERESLGLILSKMRPDYDVSFLISFSPGVAQAVAAELSQQGHEEVAHAHAHWQREGGSDESPVISVNVGGQVVVVLLEQQDEKVACRTTEV